jgi:hypothetical protein
MAKSENGKKKKRGEAKREAVRKRATEADVAERMDEVRGAYIGPVERDEALQTISSQIGAEVLVEWPSKGFAGGDLRRGSGMSWDVGGEDSRVFVFSKDQGAPLAGGHLYSDCIVLDLSPRELELVNGDVVPAWTAARYTDGLDIHFYGGAVVRLVFRQSTLTETDSGDAVPGMTSETSVTARGHEDDLGRRSRD